MQSTTVSGRLGGHLDGRDNKIMRARARQRGRPRGEARGGVIPVVPAKRHLARRAGTHNPRTSFGASWLRADIEPTTTAGGYGSPLSRGRQLPHGSADLIDREAAPAWGMAGRTT